MTAGALEEAIDQLGATANRIADDRNALLKALRDVINAVDIHGASSIAYHGARAEAIRLLVKLKGEK